MADPMLQPTPYPDVNHVATLLLTNLHALLHDQLIGLYLGGSLALGDFNPQRSDVDFMAVTVDGLAPELVVALEQLHTRLWATGSDWARKLDGSYVPQQIVRRWTADHPPCPFVEGTSFTVTTQGSALIQRHIVRQYGRVVAGPRPDMLLDPVDADALQAGLRAMLETGWCPLLRDPAWVQHVSRQPFAILTMCRMLYSLAHGVIVSKPVAARWCQHTLDARWTRLIAWALAWPHAPDANQLASTLSLIQYTLEQARQRNTC